MSILFTSGFLDRIFYKATIYHSIPKYMFKLQSNYKPAGDQIKAIEQIKKLFESGKNKATLL